MSRSSSAPTRRTLLGLLAFAPLTGPARALTLEEAFGLEPKLPGRHFRTLKIDVSPMVKAGVPNWAARVGDAVRTAATPAFADMIDPRDRRAPPLTLLIDACNFPVYVGERWRTIPFGSFGDDGVTDWIEGHLVFGATRRRVAVTARAADAGPWYLTDIEQRRLDAVARIFAGWARREFAV